MKFSCTQSNLRTVIEAVSKAIPTKPSTPILSNILLKADSETNTVTLTGFDLKLGITSTTEAVVEQSGQLAIPAQLFTGLVNQLPSETLSLEHQSDILTLTQPSGRYRFSTQSGEDFPALPQPQNGTTLSIGAGDLIKGIDATLFAASDEETQLVLVGVHLSLDNNRLEFAATNTHYLAVAKVDNSQKSQSWKKTATATAITVPKTALSQLQKLLAVQSDAVVEVKIDPQQVRFTVGQTQLTSRLLDGAYPAYPQLIPQSFQQFFKVSKKELLLALKRLLLLGDRQQPIIKLHLNSQQQQLDLNILGTEAQAGAESLAARIEGEGLEIAFNAKYLLETLKVLPENEVQFKVNSSHSPAIITPVGATGLDCLVMLMPVQITQPETDTETESAAIDEATEPNTELAIA